MKAYTHNGLKSRRSRAGCSSCRRLRIKCGQQQPRCQQCVKRDHECDIAATGFRFYSPKVHHLPENLNHIVDVFPTRSKSTNSAFDDFPESISGSDHERQSHIDTTSILGTEVSDQAKRADELVGIVMINSMVSNTTARSTCTQIGQREDHNSTILLNSHSDDVQLAHTSSLPLADHHYDQTDTQDGAEGHPARADHAIQTSSYEQSYHPQSTLPFVLGISTHSEPVDLTHSPRTPSPRVETSQLRSFLLRHFSSTPAQWMDLFDAGCFYSRQVPMLALDSQLIMHAACALAARQLCAATVIQSWSHPYRTSTTGQSKTTDNGLHTDYALIATTYYDAAISYLLQRISGLAASDQQHSATPALDSTSSPGGQYEFDVVTENMTHLCLKPHDEVVVAVTILAIYEFLGGDAPTWSNHLDGTRSFLRLSDEAGFLDFHSSPLTGINSGPSALLRATFWNFARQDMLSALIHGKKTRLEIDDFSMWRRMGVSLCSQGRFHTGQHSFHPDYDVDQIDLISNTLVWMLCRIVNYVASCNDNSDDASYFPESEQARDIWNRLTEELQIWFHALPRSFQPCSRVNATLFRATARHEKCRDHEKAMIWHEVWHNDSMCASTMQSYHMAEIILLLHKPSNQEGLHRAQPPQSDARPRRKFADALSEHHQVSAILQSHATEICAIALSRPSEAARIHMLQPLYLAGRCLTNNSDRAVVVALIDSIEDELGWHAKYRTTALLEEWQTTRGMLTCCCS